MSFLAKQLRRMDVVGEIVYNSCCKIKTVKHTGRTMAPRIPPNANINVKPSLTYSAGDVVAAKNPISGETNFLRVVAGPWTDMISDDVPPREMKLKASTYWLEVDNSVEDVQDSRHFGPVHTTDIVGRAFNIELGDTFHPIMHNSNKAVEDDNRNAWTFPYLINSVADLFNVIKLSSDDEWIDQTLRTRVRCRVMAQQQSLPKQPVEVPEVVVA